jgi:hypothetical protein
MNFMFIFYNFYILSIFVSEIINICIHISEFPYLYLYLQILNEYDFDY